MHKNCIVGFRIRLASAAKCYVSYDNLNFLTADSEAAGPPTSIELLWHESLVVANRQYDLSAHYYFLDMYILSYLWTREAAKPLFVCTLRYSHT